MVSKDTKRFLGKPVNPQEMFHSLKDGYFQADFLILHLKYSTSCAIRILYFTNLLSIRYFSESRIVNILENVLASIMGFEPMFVTSRSRPNR